jgi:hypothetical protein
MLRLMRIVMIPALLGAWLCCATLAVADTIGDGTGQDPSGAPALDIPADLAGWFLNVNPADQWTSAANIATMESWLQIIVQLGDDPSLLSELNGLGMIDPGAITIGSNVVEAQAVVPEPATLNLMGSALLGGALLLLGLDAARRVRRARRKLAPVANYVSLRRPH